MHIMRECFKAFQVAFVLQKDSVYKDRMMDVMMRLTEAGLVTHWFNDEMDKVGTSVRARQKKTAEVKPLIIEQLQGPFVFLCLSLAISISIFLIEKCCFSIPLVPKQQENRPKTSFGLHVQYFNQWTPTGNYLEFKTK